MTRARHERVGVEGKSSCGSSVSSAGWHAGALGGGAKADEDDTGGESERVVALATLPLSQTHASHGTLTLHTHSLHPGPH